MVLVGGVTLLALGGTPAQAWAQPHPQFDLAGGLTVLGSSDIIEGGATGWVASGAVDATARRGAQTFAIT